MRRRTLLGAVGAGAVGSAVAGTAVPGSAASGSAGAGGHGRRWRHTWTAMPQLTEPGNMPPAPFTGDGVVFADTTVRQTVHVTVGGSRVRVRFSNAFGVTALPITAAAVALPVDGRAGVSATQPGSSRVLTFGGRRSVSVPAGAQIVSDPVPFLVGSGTNIAISAYFGQGQLGAPGQTPVALTSHPGSRTTSWLINGDFSEKSEMSPSGGGAAAAGPVGSDHWYLISGVEVESAAGGLVVVGDSLSDGRGSTTNGNDRWPDQLYARWPSVAVLNQAAGGNRVLNDGLGPSVLARLDRDVLATSGADRMLLFEGVNDIGTAPATDEGQRQVVADLLVAYEQIVLRAHAVGIPVYGATITPFGGNEGYDDPAGLRERSRQAVNERIRHGRLFDAAIDFDRAVRDPAVPRQIAPGYDTGDHLHLDPAGYRALAHAVPAKLLTF
ncbi:SGNH/GDSL hydrolase family protein [Actinoplanes sp. TBRC 11911]|uniref:SGNH/GDSL hydrolase family protein n=1 Tax=Actinoplanes sp. TBRC 11911 TaxID=2729386 RepID=UPI00145DA696|nr:SGNH/GDSL hydrolase family protein [Actinoplanes sp. TBRC 11911]NMO55658.1 SGNH/GDSL hydrolase family protein [Actinoplanes sp. TBRC 11911]